jgi:hypothetical protein
MKKETREDYQHYDPGKLYKNPRSHLWSPNTYFISVVILAVIVFISLPVFIESIVHWYRFIPPSLLFLSGSIFFFVKCCRGIIKKYVRIFPEGNQKLSNEAGFVGGKSSSYASGRAAVIAGIIFAACGFVCLRISIHFLVLLLRSLK